MNEDRRQVLLLCLSLCYCIPAIPAPPSCPPLSLAAIFICPSQRVYLAVLLLFRFTFFPNFPPSLPRALSYSQDIKVIHAKDLIKALLSQNITTSQSALLILFSIDSDIFQFILFFLSFPFFSLFVFLSLTTLSVSVFRIVLLCYTPAVISAVSIFYLSSLFLWLHHYCPSL